MNIEQQNWFSTPVWQVETELPLGEVKTLVKKIRKKDPKGTKISNEGGWQSRAYPNVCSKYEKDYGIANEMKPVISLLNNIAGATVEQRLDISDDIKLANFWFNVNSRGNYNTLHNHRGGIISGVLYILVPDDNCGGITFERTDKELQYYLPPFLDNHNEFTSSIFTLNPKEGSLILFPSWFNHRVEPSQSQNSRVSMSFNYTFTDFLGWET
jgi:uncharacterized protein (TIGR02466 family)|tara:strand:+ start:177 stop:812 length:636 start_codon:yes stop_codon:yes gene_type:complete